MKFACESEDCDAWTDFPDVFLFSWLTIHVEKRTHFCSLTLNSRGISIREGTHDRGLSAGLKDAIVRPFRPYFILSARIASSHGEEEEEPYHFMTRWGERDTDKHLARTSATT